MNIFSRFVFAGCVSSFFAFAPSLNYQNTTRSQFVAKTFEESRGPRSFFESRSDFEIDRMRFDPSPKIFFYAKWISLQRRIEKKIGELETNLSKREFLGYVEAKLSVDIPVWWKAEIMALDLEGASVLPKGLQHKGFGQTRGVRHSQDITIDEFGQFGITGQKNKSDFKIDWEFEFSMEDELADFFAIEVLADGRNLATLSEQLGTQHTLVFCEKDGRKIWSSNVLGNSDFNIGGSGPGSETFIEIRVVEQNVIVFGVNGTSVYFEVFSLENGSAIARFSTYY